MVMKKDISISKKKNSTKESSNFIIAIKNRKCQRTIFTVIFRLFRRYEKICSNPKRQTNKSTSKELMLQVRIK